MSAETRDQTREIHMQVMWNRLISVVEEQAMTLLRTAFSTSVREAGDLSAGVFDPQGRMLAQATFEGAAAMATQSPLHPSELRAQVTSKGGTTHAAITSLDDSGVKSAFVKRWRRSLVRLWMVGKSLENFMWSSKRESNRGWVQETMSKPFEH